MEAELIEAKESMPMQTPEIGELAAALAAAQADIHNAVKSSVNPYYKSRYADLATVMDACRAPLAKNGLAVIQTTDGTDGEQVIIITTLAHKSGQWIRGRIVMRTEKTDPQTIGKCITYARRYALAAIVGVAPEDDDGNSASGVAEKIAAATKPAPAARPKTESKPAPKPPAKDDASKWPAAADEQIPDRLQALMADSGISIFGLRNYLIGKGWIKPHQKIMDMSRDLYHEMIKPENWKVVIGRIKQAA
jgi:hypothetical protein